MYNLIVIHTICCDNIITEEWAFFGLKSVIDYVKIDKYDQD